MKTTAIAILLAFALGNTSTANAEVVTFQVTAIVDSVDDPNGLLGGSILIGNTLTSILQYDTSLTDSEPAADTGLYDATPPEDNFIEGTDGASGFFKTVDFFDVAVQNFSAGEEGDFIVFFATGDTTPSTLAHPSVDFVDFAIFLQDLDSTVFSDDSLPATLDLADFEVAEVEFSSEDGDQNFVYFVEATITDITPVPEPSTLLLAIVAAMGLLLRALVRRKS